MTTATLDDLIALNDEIGALVRAGVPLEQGLADLGADMPGRLGKVAVALAERTARGESLDQALMDRAAALPAAYRAVVEAGMRAGRLPAALEAVAASARRIAETQRAAVVAVSYPLMVFGVVWCGLAIFTRSLAPHLASAFHSFDAPGQRVFAVMAFVGRWAWYWGPAVPALVAAIVLAWWYACTRAGTMHTRLADWLLGWLPWMGRMLRCSRLAAFLEILALLVENKTPLDEAVALAAEVSGDRKTLLAAKRLSEAIRRGQTKPGGDCPNFRPSENGTVPFIAAGVSQFPPLMNWLMLAANRDGALLPALQHSAATYHRRARNEAELVRMFLPAFLTVAIAGSVTVAYALMLFLPYTMMLNALAR